MFLFYKFDLFVDCIKDIYGYFVISLKNLDFINMRDSILVIFAYLYKNAQTRTQNIKLLDQENVVFKSSTFSFQNLSSVCFSC